MSAATYSFKGTADFSKHNQEVEGAKKEIKKYEDEVKKAQKETNKLGNPNFSKAYTSQRNLQNTVKQTTNVMNGLSGNMMGAIAKFGPYAAAAVAAFKLVEAAINKARSVNEDFNDSVEKLTSQIKGAFDEFTNRLTRMDFSNFINGLATAAQYAGAIAESLDKAGTFKLVSSPEIGGIQNTIASLKIQRDELEIEKKRLKKEGKDYSHIEEQVAAINAKIEEEINNLKGIYEYQKSQAMETASNVAAYMGVNKENINALYGTSGVNSKYMNTALAAMSGWNNYIKAQYNSPAGIKGMLQSRDLVNFIANDIGSPLLNNIQKDFKQLLAAWDNGNTALANKMSQKLFGVDANQMNDTLNAINDFVKAAHSRMTEGNDGNLTKYIGQLNNAVAAEAAVIAARGEQVAGRAAEVRTAYVPPSGGGSSASKGPDWVKGSIGEIDDAIKKLKDRLENEKFDLNTQIDITKQIEELENKKAMLELQVAIGGNTDLVGAFGSLLDGILKSGDVEEFSKGMVDLMDKYFKSQADLQLPAAIFPSKEMEDSAREAMKNLDAIIEEEYNKIITEIQNENLELADSFSAVGSAFESLGTIMGESAGRWASVFGSILSTVGETIAKLVALASANGVASAFELPFPANLGALATVLAGVASAVSTITSYSNQSFASGGIFEGSGSRIGDMHLARVNPGEMILNGQEQANLFRLLSQGGGNAQPQGGAVTFHISGTDLVGVLNNYDRSRARVR